MKFRLWLRAALLPPRALSACDQPKPRPPVAPAQAAAPAAPPPPADVAGLARREEMATHTLDKINEAADPYNRPATISSAGPTTFTGFIFDPIAKLPGKAASILVDGKPYAAAYGHARADVAAYFKNPSVTNVGFLATLPAGTLQPGRHEVVIRVIAADGAAYFESARTAFTVQ